MGLDMYLEARRTVAPGDPVLAPVRQAIAGAIGYTLPAEKPGHVPDLMEICAVVVRAGRWGNFWPLHNWFVNTVQEGHDDSRPVFLDADTLEDLEEILDQVDDDPDSASEYFMDETVDTVRLDPKDVDFTIRVIVQARKLQAQGWDIYYCGSW